MAKPAREDSATQTVKATAKNVDELVKVLRSTDFANRDQAIVVVDGRERKFNRHPTKDGVDRGGWVESTAHVDESAVIGQNVIVMDWAKVLDRSRVSDNVIVKEKAILRGIAKAAGAGTVGGETVIEQEAFAIGPFTLSGKTLLTGAAGAIGFLQLEDVELRKLAVLAGAGRVKGFKSEEPKVFRVPEDI